MRVRCITNITKGLIYHITAETNTDYEVIDDVGDIRLYPKKYFKLIYETNPIDNVNKPSHYTSGTIETIDYLQDNMTAEMFEGFCIGNTLKYLSRYRHKNGLEDLQKARFYLEKIIQIKERDL